MKQLEQEIKTGQLLPAYLIYGPEDFLRQKCKNALREALGGEDAANYTYREGPGTDEEEIRILAGTVPFLAEKRLILLENTGWGKKGGQSLARDLETLPETTVLVLVEREADEKSPLFKAIEARGRCIPCEPYKSPVLKNILRASFAAEGYEIDSQTLEHFIERCGTDIATLALEKEKLLAYCMESRIIRREDVDIITHQALQDKVFDMVDAMAEGNPGKAFRLYEDAKALKVSPSAMLGIILAQMARLCVLRELDENGLSLKEMERITRYKSGLIRKDIRLCRTFSSRIWRQKWEKMLDYQHATRRSELEDSLAVEMALVEMSLQ